MSIGPRHNPNTRLHEYCEAYTNIARGFLIAMECPSPSPGDGPVGMNAAVNMGLYQKRYTFSDIAQNFFRQIVETVQGCTVTVVLRRQAFYIERVVHVHLYYVHLSFLFSAFQNCLLFIVRVHVKAMFL